MQTDQQGQRAENELKLFRSGNDATRSNNRAHGRMQSPFIGLSPADAERLVAREAKMGALAGASENAPIELLIDQTARRIPGFQTLVNTPFWGQFKRVAGRIILQGMAEGGQEGGQQIASNLISQFMTNPNQKWDESVAHNALIGAIVGTGMQATQEVGSAAVPKSAPVATAPDAAPPPAAAPAPRIEPTLIPNAPAAPAASVDASTDVLLKSGYTAEDIADMNPTERASALQAASDPAGVTPKSAEVRAAAPIPIEQPVNPIPEVGTAPMAPRVAAQPMAVPEGFILDDVPAAPAPQEAGPIQPISEPEAVKQGGKRRVGSFEIAGDDVTPEEMFGIGSRKEDRYDQEGEDAHSDVGVNMDEKGNIVDDDGNIVEGGRIEDAPKDWGATSKAEPPPPKPAARAPIMRRDMEHDTASTAEGRKVPVRYAIVEAADLITSQRDDGGTNPDYPEEMQPRDRDRAVSDQQIQKIAKDIDPRQLDKSSIASFGAPIISEDGVVESGNGRTLALRKAYAENKQSIAQYRDHLKAQGYPVDGLKQPVLVRVRQGKMAAEDRQAFAREANIRDSLGMSASEQAMSDGNSLKDSLLALHRGGDIDAAGNREFVRGFMREVVSKNDQADMVASDGQISQGAIRRIRGALLAKAYGDADFVEKMTESTEDNTKAIGGALLDVAPAWAQMRAEVKAGKIDKDADQTARLLEAVRLVERSRTDGQPLALLVGQNDIFSGATMHPTAEFFLSLMFHDTLRWKQPMGREKLGAALQFYVEEERKTSSGVDLLGETAAKPNDILALAKRKQENGEAARSTDQAKLDLAPRPRADNGKDAGDAGERGTAQAAPRAEAASSPEVAGDGRGKPELAEDENEVSQSRNYHPLNSFIPHEKTNLGGRAKEYVLRRGKEKGAEVLLAFDGEGNVVSDGYGSPKTVEPSELHNQMNNDPASKIVVHHNHPSSSSFSAADITMLAKPGAAVIWAHGTDGHSYRATLNPELRAATDPSYLGNMLWYMLRRNMGVIYDVLQGRVTDEKISVDTAQLLLTHYRSLALHRAGITDYFTTREFAPDSEIEQAVEETAAFLRRTLADEDITIGRSAKSIRYLGDMGVLAEGTGNAAGGRPEAAPERGSGRNNREKEEGKKLDEGDDPHFTPPGVATLKEDAEKFKPAPFKRSSPRKGPPTPVTSFDPLHDQPMEAWADDTLRYWGAGQKIDQMVRAAALEKYTTLKDRHVAISRLVEAIERRIGKALPDHMNPFLASRLFAGRMPEAVRVFEETRVKPLVEAMAKRKISPAELGPWLQARHVEERNKHLGQYFDPGDPFYEAMTDPSIIGASGWSQNEADAVLEKVRRSGRSADFEHVADMVYQINDEALAVRLKAGLMDQESYDRISSTYEYFVPHQGFEAEPDNADFIPGIGRGFDLRAPEFKRALGRRSKADNPLAYVVSSAKKGIIRGEKARVDRSMLLVAQTYPNPELYQIDKVETKRIAVVDAEGNTTIQDVRDRGADQADNVVVVKIGGKARRITFTDGKGDRLARAFKNLEVPQLGPFVRFMHTLNRMWAQLNTSRSPEFLTKNFHIDSITALININAEGKAKAALTMVRTVARAMRGMNRHLKGKHDTVWANHAADYAAHGGKMEYLGLIGIENEKKMFERLYKQQTERVPMTKKALWDATMGRLERWNDALENAWRLSAYVALVKHGVSKDRAAQAARDLTVDFSVHGEYGPNINAFYAFFNATAEGQINIIKRYVYNKHTRRVFNGLILLGFTQTLLNYWVANDDDDGEDRYAKIPDFVKLNNFVVMAPSWVPEKYKPKSGYYTYPARGWNIFHVIGQMAAETVVGDRSPTEAASIIATSLIDFANPLGRSGGSLTHQLINTVSPTMTDPIFDIGFNENFMGSEIVPGAGKYDKRPQSERYRNTTSDAFVYPAKKMNELTGGSDERSGAIDISPEVLEHWYEFVTGGVGRLLSRSWNTIENVVDGTSLDPEKLPFARLYFGQDQSFEDRNLYYKIKDAVETTERELKAREEEGDFKAADAVAKKYWRETQIIEAVNDVEKDLSDLRKEKREMQKNLEVDEATRRAVIKDIDAQMDSQMLDIRRLWNRLRKQKVTE
ncbi:MAG: hypothetical protein K8F90_20505 [Hyphomicrobiales bacterium]|nr:hypothetical protein [Hyphomicrobiales bacterium]